MKVGSKGLGSKLTALFAGVTVLGGLLVAPASATHDSRRPDCPAVMPVANIAKGIVGEGWTVSSGREPQPFSAEVLGVLEDGIGPGRDMIVIKATGAAIEQAGGIWFGMSGSPVYYNGMLMGAVAFGLSFGPSNIGGLTAAEDMMKVLGYPVTEEDGSSSAPAASMPATVPLSAGMQNTIAGETGGDPEDVGNNMEQLKAPFSASGLSQRGFRKLKRTIAREELPLVPYTGSSASSSNVSATAVAPHPGDSFAAALSYGDITFAGVGTTTFICGGKVMAFGHPFFFQGDTTLGGNAADAITIVKDPTFGSYKLANIEEAIGTVDQDRLAGIRAVVGELPSLIPITSTVNSLSTNTARDGQTDVVLSEFVPFLAFFHMLTNVDVTFDEIGPGSSTLDWTVNGTREDGTVWSLSRPNMFASEYDISYEQIFELESMLYRIYFNDFEEIEFTDIDLSSTVDDEVRRYEMTEVLVSKNGVDYKDVRRIRVRPGTTIGLRITLTPFDEAGDRVVDLSVVVPERARRDGFIEIRGGSDPYDFEGACFAEGEECAGGGSNKIESFDDLLAALGAKAKNNELIAKFRIGRRVKSSDLEVLDQVVSGQRNIYVRIVGGRGGESVTSEPKPQQQ